MVTCFIFSQKLSRDSAELVNRSEIIYIIILSFLHEI